MSTCLYLDTSASRQRERLGRPAPSESKTKGGVPSRPPTLPGAPLDLDAICAQPPLPPTGEVAKPRAVRPEGERVRDLIKKFPACCRYSIIRPGVRRRVATPGCVELSARHPSRTPRR